MIRGKITLYSLIIFYLLVQFASKTMAQKEGKIKLKNSDTVISGKILWSAAEKEYMVLLDDSQASISLPLEKVERIKIRPPVELSEAVKKVRNKSYVGAHIEKLRRIVSVYLMLEHDLKAASYLVEAYLATGYSKEAAKICKKVMADKNSSRLSTEFMRMYWRTLLENKHYDILQKELKGTIEQGPRPIAAIAQLIRGDMDMRQGEYEKALIDGYLRIVILFRKVYSVQAEALYKAAQCFEKLGEHANAEKMLEKLVSEYPNSYYNNKMKEDA